MKPYYPLLINGEFKDAAHKQELINPSTKEPIAEVAFADAKDVDAALDAARAAFDHGPWKKITLDERKKIILKISQGILDRAGELARLESLNTGKPIKEATFMDIPSSAKTFEYFADNIEKLLKEETIEVPGQARARLLREPIGVVVLIIPWNYPLLIASWKLAQALAAGNTVVLKPSSLTPLTALELAKIIKESGVPAGVVNIICAKAETMGKVLSKDKRADMISFTGSNAVGKEIQGYCASNAKKLIMELGGKSASVILKDADLELAVNGSLCSVFLNQGQMCTAMSRIFVAEEIHDKFIAEFVAKAKQIKLGDGLNYQTQIGPLISEAQRKKVIAYVEKAKKQGAKLLCGGKIPESEDLKNGFFFEPAILVDVSPEMEIFQEEVFGPVACVSKFSNLKDAIGLANKSDFALAASIWTQDEISAQKLSREINAGVVWINTYGMFYNQLPYGGFKQSGFGKELGKEGFLEYTRLKNIITDQPQDSKPLINYWYGF